MHRPDISLPSYFGATLVINLVERTDRRRSIETEFRKAGWKGYEFFPAVRTNDANGFPSPSIRGCFLSHLRCLRIAQERNLDTILVCEDDLALSPSIPRLIPFIVQTIEKTDWDFLYFGHHKSGDIPTATRKTDRVAFEPCHVEFATTHFFAVNRRIIPRLIAHFERLEQGTPGDSDFGPMPADGAFNTFRRHNPDVITYLANPKLGWQRPSRSEISPHRLDTIKVIRPLIGLVRNIKYLLNFN